jgi:ElaB/YqjD/DUF883 family membrane-anchored ribosome-binding protein
MNTVFEKVESFAKAVGQKGSEVIKDADLDIRFLEIKERTEDFIRRKPVESVAIGLLVGVILGRMLTRK